MAILNSGNAKTRKGQKLGWKTYGIHFAPEKLSGFNVCKCASLGCTSSCLNTAGRGAMSSVQRARIEKTRKFFLHKEAFMSELFSEIRKAIRKAEKEKLNPCFRLNLTSDIPWENVRHDGVSVFEAFPNVRFYDYTKYADRMARFLAGELPANYHLTFSRSESNDPLVQAVMTSGGNVAVVFRKTLPKSWRGVPVVDGDETDLRFLDKQGVIVGLVEKGKAKKDNSGFVVERGEE
jgi:hypothetical protein